MTKVKLEVKHGLFEKREKYAKCSPFTPTEIFVGELLSSEKRSEGVVLHLKDPSLKFPFVRQIKLKDVVRGWKL